MDKSIAPYRSAQTAPLRGGFSSIKTERVFVFGAALLYLGFLLFYAAIFHPVKDAALDNPELDFYERYAARIAAGELPRDPFRPALYPALGAIAGKLTGDYYHACQFISILSGAAFVVLSFLIARQLFGLPAAWIAATLVAVNPHVILASSRAASDMLFQALAMAALFVCITFNKKRAILLGVLFGLAFVTRYTAVALLPVIAMAFYRNRQALSYKDYAAFGLAALLTASPQLILNQVQFGSPFYNENWRNVAIHYFGLRGLDWNAGFTQYSKEYLVQQLSAHPFLFALKGTLDILWFLLHTLPGMLFGAWANKAGALILCLILPPLILARKARPYLLIYAIINVALVGFTFDLFPRYVLPLIPIAYILLSGFCVRLISKDTRTWPG